MSLQHEQSDIQRSFIEWFDNSKHLFETPITISNRSAQSIELTFNEAKSMISATLTSQEMHVKFNREGVFWDYLIYFEAMPELYRDYYVCALRYPKDETLYASCEILWELRLFEPFLTWVNNTLTKMPWIELNEQKSTESSAKLVNSLPADYDLVTSQNYTSKAIYDNPLYRQTYHCNH